MDNDVGNSTDLTDEEKAVYEWQIWSKGFGELGQQRLKQASVLVSRVGGIGGLVAYELAAAGIGKLVLAHAGIVRPSDLNRQLLMTHDWVGKPRIDSIQRRLLELNPRLKIECIAENISDANAAHLIEKVDVVADCAPLFEERFAMNRECVRQKKPLVECSMYDMEARLTTIVPGQTPCLACLHPTTPPNWRRQFPVFGAVSGAVACMGAMEVIKIIAKVGDPLLGRVLHCDLRTMSFRVLNHRKRDDCSVCGGKNSPL